MSTAGVGILGALGGAGLTYAWAKNKINDFEAQIRGLLQQIRSLQFDNQALRNEIIVKGNIIIQKDQELRQKDEQIAVRDAEINQLKEERKRALSN